MSYTVVYTERWGNGWRNVHEEGFTTIESAQEFAETVTIGDPEIWEIPDTEE